MKKLLCILTILLLLTACQPKVQEVNPYLEYQGMVHVLDTCSTIEYSSDTVLTVTIEGESHDLANHLTARVNSEVEAFSFLSESSSFAGASTHKMYYQGGNLYVDNESNKDLAAHLPNLQYYLDLPFAEAQSGLLSERYLSFSEIKVITASKKSATNYIFELDSATTGKLFLQGVTGELLENHAILISEISEKPLRYEILLDSNGLPTKQIITCAGKYSQDGTEYLLELAHTITLVSINKPVELSFPDDLESYLPIGLFS